jgi:hypothetical protein
MKNIHLLTTDKPSRLGYLTKKGKEVFKDLRLFDKPMPNILDSENQHIYITSDEEIKVDEYYLGEDNNIYCLVSSVNYNGKKIILTTDKELIKDGVQAISDEFLEWFVKNPSCEEVEVKSESSRKFGLWKPECYPQIYKIFIPQEEVFEMYSHLYGKTVTMDDRFETKHIWSEELALKNKGRWIPQEEPKQEGYICPHTKIQCDDECCVSAEDCHITSSLASGMVDCKEPKHIPYKGKVWEPPKETLEEAAEKYARKQCDDMYDNEGLTGASWGWETSLDFIAGAKWQAERMYSEDEVRNIANWAFDFYKTDEFSDSELEDEFNRILSERFKKK